MKNPLRKRLWRDLRSEIGKYAVIFLLLTGTTGFVSGFMVAAGSMLQTYDESFEKYNIEDGYFQIQAQANRAQVRDIEELGVTVYENFYTEEALTNGSTLRIFRTREQVDLVCLMEGALPVQPGEIAIDRMYADNNGLEVGDTIQSAGRSWTVTGLVALSDYSCLFSDNNDAMFDSVLFGVAVVCSAEFDTYAGDTLVYNYAWKYADPPEDEAQERDMAETFMDELNRIVTLEAFVPRYQNQAIQFTGEDMGSDRAMMIMLLYIVVIIMAFVFAIITITTISRESTVIGTLRASGYTRAELTRHYMAMPMIVTLTGAVVGNILGYTVFKDVCAAMYYGSYSLPTYVTIWSGEAFWMTTAVPVAIMGAVNYLILRRTLTLEPLKFLRRDLSRRRQRRALPLPKGLGFFTRFRIRVVLQNLGNYAILLVGILFANLLLLFGLIMPSILDHYQAEIEGNLLCQYQYILKVPLSAMDDSRRLESMVSMLAFQYEVQTDNETAEPFSAYALQTIPEGDNKADEITLYGVQDESRYIDAELSGGGVVVSAAYADKYSLEPGDVITLKEEYEDGTYIFTVDGIYDYMGGLVVFMPQEMLNETFGLGESYFSGYFSDTEIEDIDEAYIASVIDLDTLTKISRQLDVSMGGIMQLMDAFAVVMFMALIYLLSKIIIEKNGQAISMAKILGYGDREIGRLYILPTSIVVVVLFAASLPIETMVMEYLYRKFIMMEMTGWIAFYMDPMIYVKMMAFGLATYGVVAALEYRRVRAVPMDTALKNLE